MPRVFGLGPGDELAVRGLVDLGLQPQHLAAEILPLERVRDQRADLVAPDVLGDEVERAELHRLAPPTRRPRRPTS